MGNPIPILHLPPSSRDRHILGTEVCMRLISRYPGPLAGRGTATFSSSAAMRAIATQCLGFADMEALEELSSQTLRDPLLFSKFVWRWRCCQCKDFLISFDKDTCTNCEKHRRCFECPVEWVRHRLHADTSSADRHRNHRQGDVPTLVFPDACSALARSICLTQPPERN